VGCALAAPFGGTVKTNIKKIMLQSTKSPTLVIVLIDKNQKVLRTEVEL
jgi:hypothetical protein